MSQSKPNPQRAQALRNLYEQAQQAAQHSAIRLKRAQAEQTQAEGKLHSLQQLKRQYRSQLAELEQRGGSWGAVRDLRAFIDRLGAAQAAQRDEIMNTRTRCEEHLRAWTAARQKEKAFEVLLAQEHGLAQAVLRQRQQSDLHECAGELFLWKVLPPLASKRHKVYHTKHNEDCSLKSL